MSSNTSAETPEEGKPDYEVIYIRKGLSFLLEELANHGYCPNLLNDDSGRWALRFDGYQTVVMTKGSSDVDTSFFVPKQAWKNTVDAAVKFALKHL